MEKQVYIASAAIHALCRVGLGVLVGAVPLIMSPSPVQAGQSPARSAVESPATSSRALLNRYCVVCHNERGKARAAGLALDTLDVFNPSARPDAWEKVARKLRAGLMPPAGRPRPESSIREAFVSWLETELDRAAAAHPQPGRKEALHRLNRAEYHNAVRDLLALDIDVNALLPADDASYGFDNMAGILRISQARLEQYLAAAWKISRAAVGTVLPAPTAAEFRVPETMRQYDHVEGLPFGTRGGMLIRYRFPQDGEYEVAVELLCRIAGECDGSAGFTDDHQLVVLLDGEQVERFTLEARRELRPRAERTWRIRLPVAAGPHEVGVTFLKLPSIREVDSAYARFLRPYYINGVNAGGGLAHQTIYQPFVDRVTITGPLVAAADPADTPSRRRVFVCQPKSQDQETACADTSLLGLARRAYRRPVNEGDLEVLRRFYRDGRAEGGSFEAGIEAALRRILMSPEFLFRIEREPANVAPGAVYRVSDLELASRLSFFLWSSIPDEELLQLAERGNLSEPTALEQQVRRMIADPRAEALVKNFAGQWLLLRNLDLIQPDLPLFPNFDDSLRSAFRRETELFVDSVLRENRGVLELLSADYTFVNERLARHYGIPHVYGDRFRRVTLTKGPRRGFLGHGSILATTSRPNRTSPVLRGKWILENILGTPPPAPPANVPSFPEVGKGNHEKGGTVRERMAQHRSNPVCSACHSMIDPPGFALENFDAVGKWRAVDEKFRPIDASGVLPDGTAFDGLEAFRTTLLKNPEPFVMTVTQKLLTYALGRGLEPYDMPAVRRIMRDTAPADYRLSDVVMGIVNSVPFQMRQAGESANASARGVTPDAVGASLKP